MPTVARCPRSPHPGWHSRGAVGYQVAQPWHWFRAIPPTGTVPGTAPAAGLCYGRLLALHPQCCPSQGAAGLRWGVVGHRATGREQKTRMGPQQRMANVGQIPPVPPCLSFPSCYRGPCESPSPCLPPTVPLPTARAGQAPAQPCPSRLCPRSPQLAANPPSRGAAAASVTARGRERRRCCRAQLGLCPPGGSRGGGEGGFGARCQMVPDPPGEEM